MNWKKPKTYAVVHKNSVIRDESRSGGIFTALSDRVLENDGVVYGCVLNNNSVAEHIRADSKELRDRMRGSKYIQSKIGNTYKSVKADLENNKKVLFSGTSCQIAGLKSYLNKEYDNLLCVDIVCHGVPSPHVWKKYLEWQEKKHQSEVANTFFRNKKDYGWRAHVETLIMKNGKQIDSRVFKSIFYGHMALRPCCYECHYKSIMHPGDITIADYWGIEKAAPSFDDNKGVSLVLINNDKGEEFFESIKSNILWEATKIEDSMQYPLIKPYDAPKNREKFWNDLNTKDFEYIAKKYGDYGTKNAIYRKMRNLKKKLIKLLKR